MRVFGAKHAAGWLYVSLHQVVERFLVDNYVKPILVLGIVVGLAMFVWGDHIPRTNPQQAIIQEIQKWKQEDARAMAALKCNLEEAKKRHPEVYKEYEKAVEAYNEATRSSALPGEVTSLTKNLPDFGAVELPELHMQNFSNGLGYNLVPKLKLFEDLCYLAVVREKEETGLKIGSKDWALFARFTALATQYFGETNRMSQADRFAFFLSGFWQPRGVGAVESFDVVPDPETDNRLEFTPFYVRVKHIVNNEQDLMKIGEALLPHTTSILVGGSDTSVRLWLPRAMEASYANFPQLESAVNNDDRRHGARWIDNHGSYLNLYKLKPEGWFMRRWMDMGRGEAGADRIVVYRFWMARLADELHMPQAQSWKQKVKDEIANTTTIDKTWYLARL